MNSKVEFLIFIAGAAVLFIVYNSGGAVAIAHVAATVITPVLLGYAAYQWWRNRRKAKEPPQ